MKKPYTVVGFFGDNNQPWVGHVYAEDITKIPEAARADVRAANGESGDYSASELFIVEAFEGHIHSCLQNEEVVSPE